jgi:hypothetical protein
MPRVQAHVRNPTARAHRRALGRVGPEWGVSIYRCCQLMRLRKFLLLSWTRATIRFYTELARPLCSPVPLALTGFDLSYILLGSHSTLLVLLYCHFWPHLIIHIIIPPPHHGDTSQTSRAYMQHAGIWTHYTHVSNCKTARRPGI